MFKLNRVSYLNRLIISLLILMFISACNDSNDKSVDQGEVVDTGVPELVLVEEEPKPEVIVIPDFPLYLNGTSLGTSYPEYYSGFWRGSYCGGTGFALVGVNGMSAEVNTGATFMNSTMGAIDSSGEFLFPSREVNWDCEECGEVRPLTIKGEINYDSKTGKLIFEVACSAGNGHFISNINVELKSGISQPSPFNEMQRIKNEIINLSGKDLTCNSDDQCKMIKLGSNDFCNSDAIIYSDATVNEESLFELENEYHQKEWLSGQGSESRFTICADVRRPVCIESNCTFTSL